MQGTTVRNFIEYEGLQVAQEDYMDCGRRQPVTEWFAQYFITRDQGSVKLALGAPIDKPLQDNLDDKVATRISELWSHPSA